SAALSSQNEILLRVKTDASASRLPPGLHSLDVISLQALRALTNLEAHSRALFERLVAIASDSGEVHENVIAAFTTDKSVTLSRRCPRKLSLLRRADTLLCYPVNSSLTTMELFELTQALVDIESITGHEQACADFLRRRLAQRGFQVELQDVTPGRSNVLAFW